MNRYVAAGAALDALGGKRVLIYCSRRDLPAALGAVASVAPEVVSRVSHAAGRQSVEFSTGGRVVFARSEMGMRGHTADVVLIDEAHLAPPDVYVSAAIAVNPTGGEVIRA